MTEAVRICPHTKSVCEAALPEDVDRISVNGEEIRICGFACAEEYAKLNGQVVSGEFFHSDGKRREIEYSTSRLRETPPKEVR